MDWHEVPSEIGGEVEVSVWHELVEEQDEKQNTLLPTNHQPGNITTIWQHPDRSEPEIVEFTQKVSYKFCDNKRDSCMLKYFHHRISYQP